MVLFVVGDVDVANIYDVVATHENQRDKEAQPQIVRDPLIEKATVNESKVTETMKLQSPRLMLGFKNNPLVDEPDASFVKRDLEMTLFYEMLFGEETDFYQSLLNEDLIDETFGYQFVLEPTYSFSVITSATQYPDKLKALLLTEIENNQGQLNDEEAFSLLKKQFIGEFISGLNAPEYIANQYTKLYFEGVSLFDLLEIVESITLESVNETSKMCLNLEQVVDSRLEMK